DCGVVRGGKGKGRLPLYLDLHPKALAQPVDVSGLPLPARLEALRHSQDLNRAAAEYDGGLCRLHAAIACLDDAVEAIEGRIVQRDRDEAAPEMSMEAVAIQAQEEERYRLAREIHDGPAQILANVALQLEYISKLATREPVRARDELTNIQRDLRMAVGEVRRFMYDLRPPALAQQGVGPAVESHCQRLAERFGMKVQVQWESTLPFAPSHDTAVFRMVQEALQNVVKHAQATEVQVRAVDKDSTIEVSVSDNGKGFDATQVRKLDPKHFGLAGMRARAQQIGATLDVTSTPGSGTTIYIRVAAAV
ncbi:MAG TPA: sensor histidine kinase, partial [Chloroflexota bacterium]|nr:sensor histidine kinase [Chloroflexota bacterium]